MLGSMGSRNYCVSRGDGGTERIISEGQSRRLAAQEGCDWGWRVGQRPDAFVSLEDEDRMGMEGREDTDSYTQAPDVSRSLVIYHPVVTEQEAFL